MVGGVTLHEGKKEAAFHRWTEVYFPNVGWIPVDVSRIDSNKSFDFEHLFGMPGYTIALSRGGGIDPKGLRSHYLFYRSYSHTGRKRRAYAENLFHELKNKTGIIELKLNQ